jgi:hypothetical protein
MPPEKLECDDLMWVERRRDVRIIISLPGRYSLADRRDARGERRQFACRAINISKHAIALATPVIGRLGERVIADIDGLPRLQGGIARLLGGRGFVMSILASDEQRDALASKIEWLDDHKNLDVSDSRGRKRFVPKDPHSTMVLHDGTVASCFVIDVSASGAAVSADLVPAVGTVLAVGKVIGRVVRHFVGGFAIKFVHHHDPDNIEALVISAT